MATAAKKAAKRAPARHAAKKTAAKKAPAKRTAKPKTERVLLWVGKGKDRQLLWVDQPVGQGDKA